MFEIKEDKITWAKGIMIFIRLIKKVNYFSTVSQIAMEIIVVSL